MELNFVPLLDKLAEYFQIRDDYMNLAMTIMVIKVFRRPDGRKFSFPILHGIRSNPSDSRLLNILKQRTQDVDGKCMQ